MKSFKKILTFLMLMSVSHGYAVYKQHVTVGNKAGFAVDYIIDWGALWRGWDEGNMASNSTVHLKAPISTYKFSNITVKTPKTFLEGVLSDWVKQSSQLKNKESRDAYSSLNNDDKWAYTTTTYVDGNDDISENGIYRYYVVITKDSRGAAFATLCKNRHEFDKKMMND